MSLDILDVVESRCQWVIDVDDDDLPIGLFLVKQGHDPKDLDLLDLSWGGNKLADLADVKGIVVTLGLGLWVENIWVFPGLISLSVEKPRSYRSSYLRECPVVPEVAFVREAIADIAKLALLDILLDRVEGLFFGNLKKLYQHHCN